MGVLYMMIYRILELRNTVLKNGYNPDYLAMNELDMRRLFDHLYIKGTYNFNESSTWISLAGCKLYDMRILLNPSLDSLQILYNVTEENEQAITNRVKNE